jgi:multiple antibiotic resistance protein
VLLAGRSQGDLARLGLLIGVIVAVVLLCVIAFLLAERVAKLFGTTGNIVLSRLLGVLLAALAVQFVVDAVRTLLAAG